MPTSTQTVREIVATQASAARVFQRFDIDLCSQAEKSLDGACAELQLSVDQVLEKLADAETQGRGGPPVDPASLSMGRLIQYIVRVHHQCVRRELPRLNDMARKLAARLDDQAPELRNIEALLEELRADMFAHIQKEEQVLFSFIYQMEQNSIVEYPPAHACFRSIAQPVSKMMQEHDSANYILAEVRRLSGGFEPHVGACGAHIALYAGLREFENDLKQHIHLENDVLFPRAIELEAELNSRR
jgi:regulator of cell morphogenesis and NO signaling